MKHCSHCGSNDTRVWGRCLDGACPMAILRAEPVAPNMPQPVLYTAETTDPVVLVARLRCLTHVRDNLAAAGCTTSGMDNAIRCVEDLLGEHLPALPAERLL